MKRAALLSVSDRTGIEEFAKGLAELGFVLLTTSGTGKILSQAGIASTPIEQYTGQPEILGGRVKTLHPKIHSGILARRDDPTHLAQMEQDQILPIDVVAVNLYPFVKHKSEGKLGSESELVEFIDIGGPTMIRGAAKNFASVFAVIDPSDYAEVLATLKENKTGSLALRRQLAAKVFATLAQDALEIAETLSRPSDSEWPNYWGVVQERVQSLRYGENPHQAAVFYNKLGKNGLGWKQLAGRELSYNNLLDLEAGIRILRDFSVPGSSSSSLAFCAIIKHLNPCGAALAETPLAALSQSKICDPRSHFGGIVICNREVDRDFAVEVSSDFAEIVVAPAFTDSSLEEFSRRKNLRVIQVDSLVNPPQMEFRSSCGGVLVQQVDKLASLDGAELVTAQVANDQQMADLKLAWTLCSHLKSNAIAIVKDGKLVASGTGQMSRVDSVELALSKARLHGHDLSGAVAASDAFFPFPDGPQNLAKAGIAAIIAPNGAKLDKETVKVCAEYGIALYFAKERHFRH